MIIRIYFFFILFLLGIGDIVAQEGWPPYKISRLFHFNFSENLIYDSNVLQNDYNPQEDISLNHNLSITHSDERPYFIYQLAYSLGYRHFLKYSELNADSHSLMAQISIQRPYYSISIANQFSISSDPRSIEFSAFNKSTSNATTVRGHYRFNNNFSMNFSTSFSTQEYVEIPFSNSTRWGYMISASYQAVEKWTFGVIYEEERSWFTSTYLENKNNTFKGNISYKIFDSLSVFTGIEYTFVNRTYSNDNYYTIPYGIQIVIKHPTESESDLTNLQWIQNVSLSINSNISNRDFRNPIDFNINASGYITQKTTWSLTATRRMDFSYLNNQQQYQTSISLGIGHIFHELRVQAQFGYQMYEYENSDVLKSFTWNVSFGYPITRWTYLNGRYSMNQRSAQNFAEDFSNHSFSLGTSVSF